MGLAAGGTAGALVATELTGSAAAAGLPTGALVAGSAAGALVISRRSGRSGRSAGLIVGYAWGVAGAVAVVAATVVGSFALVLVGSVVLGAANAAVFLTRYAGAGLAAPGGRGRALGTVLAATAVGAVLSPTLLGPSGDAAAAVGLPRLTGLYLVAVPSFGIAAALLAVFARVTARGAGAEAVSGRPRLARDLRAAWGTATARLAVVVLATTNLVMAAIMAIAPVHLHEHGHGLGFVGLVIAIHVLGMFLPAPLTGWLVDRVGGPAVTVVAVVLLVCAGLGGAVADHRSGVQATVVLAVLGLGWNAGVVAGSAMLAAAVPADVRPRVEGIGEVAMGVAAAAGAPLAGFVTASGGFPGLSFAGAAAAVVPLLAVLWVRLRGAGRDDARVRPAGEPAAVVSTPDDERLRPPVSYGG